MKKNSTNSVVTSTIFVGMDVHKESISLCSLVEEVYSNGRKKEFVLSSDTISANFNLVLNHLNNTVNGYDMNAELVCGYEAGCLGYSLQRFLSQKGINCVIVAPTTILVPQGKKRVKTDSRDAVAIAKCLAHNSCETIWIPGVEDNEIKEYIRMRDDHKTQLKKVKQQIKALCLRENIRYTGGRENWTVRFLDWLSKVELSACIREILDEYLFTYRYLIERIERFDKRIEEFSQREPYRDNVKKLCCFPGIKMLTAMAILCEIGDFKRFAKAEQFMSYLGIVPGENSSGEKQQRLNITKAGNSHIRRLLVESAHSYNRISKTKQNHESIRNEL